MLQLSAAKRQNRLREYMNKSIKSVKLLIIDEIGYMPFGSEESGYYFGLLLRGMNNLALLLQVIYLWTMSKFSK